MALIQCPECGQHISNQAAACPKCGCPVQNTHQEANETTNNNAKHEEIPSESINSSQETTSVTKKRKPLFFITTAIVLVLVLAFCLVMPSKNITVEDISFTKWKLTDSDGYDDYYEGTLISEQQAPFVAVIGQYTDENATPDFVYMNQGSGIIQVLEDADEDPSVKYKAVGYMTGTSLTDGDITTSYTEGEYIDLSYSNSTYCTLDFKIELQSSKTGLLFFELKNETGNDYERNCVATVIDGKADYTYFAEAPYKSRGFDVQITPTIFCEASPVSADDFQIEKPYTAIADFNKHLKCFNGEEVLQFSDLSQGIILYTKELLEGGEKMKRNNVDKARTFLENGTCKLLTYDSVDADENILTPKYEFHIKGYLNWITLAKEML